MKKCLSLFIALLLIVTLAIVPASAERYSLSVYSIEAPDSWTVNQSDGYLILDNRAGSSWAKLSVKDFSAYADIMSIPAYIEPAFDSVINGYVEGLGGTVETQYELEVAGVTGRVFTTSTRGTPVTGWFAFVGTDAVMFVMFDVDDPLAMLQTLQIAQ